MSAAEVVACVPGYGMSRAEFRVSVTQRDASSACHDLNGTATVGVYTGACHVHAYMTPEQCEKLAEILRKAAHESRCVSASLACAEKAHTVDAQEVSA